MLRAAPTPSTSSESPLRRIKWRYVILVLWLLFTVSLTVWWIYFGVSQLSVIGGIAHRDTESVVRHQKMLLWEGAFLILFLFGGAFSMGYLMWRERRERRRIEEFFASFTHELRTPLASLMLQAEVLGESLSSGATKQTIERFLSDASKLNLQLENSLALAERSGVLIVEELDVRTLLEEVSVETPQLQVVVHGDAIVRGDSRAFRSVISNLLQNALRHGKAGRIEFKLTPHATDTITVDVHDDGSGFQGDRQALGSLFARHYRGSGSGTGLYLVRELIQRMGGAVRFPETASGFRVVLTVPGRLV